MNRSSLVSSVCCFLGFICGITASCCNIFVTITPCWYVVYADTHISPYENCYGLWKYCSSTGLCGEWLAGSLLGQHGAQRTACRALMIVSCLVNFVSLILNILGLKCVLLFQLTPKTKEKLCKKSAFLWLLSGSLVLIASMWYALDVMQSAWEEGKAVELSSGIFVGWGSVAFSLTAAVLLWVGANTSKRERKHDVKKRNSMLATVAAVAASRQGSRVSCCCYSTPNLGEVREIRVEPFHGNLIYDQHAKVTYM